MDGIEKYKKFVREFYDERDNGHDFTLIERIISRFEELTNGLVPSPTPHRLNFLACFHGLNKHLQENSEFRNRTIQFLLSLGWSQDDIEDIFLSLARHLTDPCTVEEMIVHDANFFEVLGPFGIAKAFTVGGARGQTYEQTAEIFESNIKNVAFKTPTGTRLYEPRRQVAIDFLNNLRKEL